MPTSREYVKATACVASIVLLLVLIWFATDVLLLAFAGILAAIMLRAASDRLAQVLHVRAGLALGLVCLLLLCAAGLSFWFIAPRLSNEVDALQQNIPSAWGQFLSWFHRSKWAGHLADKIQSEGIPYRHTAGTVLTAFSGLTSAIGGLVIVLFLALYFALDPSLYVRGFLKLLPKGSEEDGKEAINRCAEQLRRWLLGKLSLMVFVGIATAVGLWAFDMPLILSLALLAALLDFIPNIGPIISAAPAVLIAFTHSPAVALEVAVLYLAVQVVESYILQPLVQQRAVSLPPSVTLLSQVLMGTLFGPLGLVLATPLTVVVLTLTNTIYVQHILHKA